MFLVVLLKVMLLGFYLGLVEATAIKVELHSFRTPLPLIFHLLHLEKHGMSGKVDRCFVGIFGFIKRFKIAWNEFGGLMSCHAIYLRMGYLPFSWKFYFKSSDCQERV